MRKIFKEENEKYNLPPDKWGTAGFYGVREKYRKPIVCGIIDSLIILSINSERIQKKCDRLVLEILQQAKLNMNLLFNISDYFSKFAELSPNSFLSFIESEIDKDCNTVRTLVEKKSSDMIMGEQSHFNQICWGLDVCLRTFEWCVQALRIYLKLYLKNYDLPQNSDLLGKTATYFAPFSSSIIPLFPDEKIKLLQINIKSINKKSEKLIVPLMKRFLSNSTRSFTVPSGPHWRIGIKEEVVCTYGDIHKFNNYVIEWLLQNTDEYSNWIESVFQNMNSITKNTLDNFFNNAANKIANFKEEEKSKIYGILIEQIYDLKFFSDIENRRAKRYYLKEYEKLLKISTPQDLILKYSYMFKKSSFSFPVKDPVPYNDESYIEINSRKAEEELKQAILEIKNYYGKDAVERILEICSDNCPIAKLMLESFEYSLVVDNLIKMNKFNLLSVCFSILDEDKVIEILEKYNDKQQLLFSTLPLKEKFVDYVNGKEFEKTYWQNKNILWSIDSSSLFEKVHEKLLKFYPIKVINYYAYKNTKFDVQMAKSALLAFVSNPEGYDGNDQYHIIKLINKLDELTYDEEIVACEFMLLPIYRHCDLPLGIKNYFWNKPEFLASLINLIFDENFKNEALKFILIMPMGQCLIPIDKIKSNPNELKDWAKALITVSENYNENSKDLVMRTIIRTISFEKESEGEIWPSEPVSDILEWFSDERLLDEFVVTKINAKGARIVKDGQEEYKQMEKYLSFANYYKLKPATNYVLKSWANTYKEEGDSDRKNSILSSY